MSSVTCVSVGKQIPAAYKAMTALTTEVQANATEVGLDPLLVELVKIRTSQINGCAFCLDMHMRVALDGIPQRQTHDYHRHGTTTLFVARGS
jgi:alkylhydroperoxidase family enzyme